MGARMFSYEILEDDEVIVLAAAGRPTAEDFQVPIPKFFADVISLGIRRLFVDWREFRGWGSKEVPTITFFSWIESRSLFDRIAVVFHDSVRHEAEQFQELLRNAGKDVRLFQPERYEEVLDWLKGDG